MSESAPLPSRSPFAVLRHQAFRWIWATALGCFSLWTIWDREPAVDGLQRLPRKRRTLREALWEVLSAESHRGDSALPPGA